MRERRVFFTERYMVFVGSIKKTIGVLPLRCYWFLPIMVSTKLIFF